MILYHKVIHLSAGTITKSIRLNGLIPQVACEYRDLVPESIRDKPVVWLTERGCPYKGEPCFAVEVKDLDGEKLYHVTDDNLAWWVYQGNIESNKVLRVAE